MHPEIRITGLSLCLICRPTCTGPPGYAQEEWQQKSVPASSILFKIKPDSNDKINKK